MINKESDYVPRQAMIDVMEILDACRRQMGLVYPFEKEQEEIYANRNR